MRNQNQYKYLFQNIHTNKVDKSVDKLVDKSVDKLVDKSVDKLVEKLE